MMMCSPWLQVERMVEETALMPQSKRTQRSAASRAASFFSAASRVGFPYRPYS